MYEYYSLPTTKRMADSSKPSHSEVPIFPPGSIVIGPGVSFGQGTTKRMADSSKPSHSEGSIVIGHSTTLQQLDNGALHWGIGGKVGKNFISICSTDPK